MITVQVKSGFNGQVYQIDSDDRAQVAEWLLSVALTYGPSQGGVYAPMTIERCKEWANS